MFTLVSDPSRRLRVVRVARNARRSADLRRALQGGDGTIELEELPHGRAIAALADRSPDVVVVDVPCELEDDLAVIAAIAASPAHPAVVVVAPPDDVEFGIAALMAGAICLVSPHAGDAALRQAVEHAAGGEAVVPGAVAMALVRRLQAQ